MIPKDELYTQTLGSLIISFYDILMMNIHYNCTGSCLLSDSASGFCEKAEHEKCNNQGFAHPRNCSKCICPSGYGGDLCNERPTTCGAELNVTSNWTQLATANLSDFEAGTEDGYKRCVYWLKAPNGSNIEVRLKKLPENVSVEGCIFAGVEVKARQDQGLTGYRFCSKDDVNTTLISNSSTVPVISYMRRRRNDTVTELEYRIARENSGEGSSKRENVAEVEPRVYSVNEDSGVANALFQEVMMPTDGSANRSQPVLVPKDSLYTRTLGSPFVSFYDLLMMNMLYNCTDTCKNTSTQCQNGGFAHPRDCSKCICPSGYGGDFCDKRAPNGSHVEVRLTKLPAHVAKEGCIYAGVEIKTREDQRLTGYRFCSKDDVNTTLISNSSTVPVISLKSNFDEVEPKVATVEEANEEAGIADALFQADIIGTAAHEIAHALGFWHAHSRHDRDDYIIVNTRNINKDYASEFVKHEPKSNDNFGLPYDYGSIMQYRATA
ncbi:EGF-like domain protein [Teladorsagia circumcincta]|uniref:Metalloendopeptidase n=1 Tax=Teladorsagia circumcincta TaxID=45464 RepID=A0A2G9UKJ0_TELCI|nr:EGF-like domain protein [Teladorsagia circumcincta]